jgi:hypothetical protein
MDMDRRTSPAADSTAPWPPVPAEESGTFRWLRPGELLAIPVPTTALQLDTLLRHLEIDGEFSDWPAATIHLAQARSTWQRLEPALTARAGGGGTHVRGTRKAARELTKALERAGKAVQAARGPEVIRQARHAIVQVATIERVFE